MMKILRHTSLLAAAMVISLVIYHVITGASTTRATARTAADVADEADQALGDAYELGSLRLLERTRYYVAEKYVDPDRIHPAEMFSAAREPSLLWISVPMERPESCARFQ